MEGARIGFDFIQGVFGTPENASRVIVHDNELRGIDGLGVGARGAEDGHVVDNVDRRGPGRRRPGRGAGRRLAGAARDRLDRRWQRPVRDTALQAGIVLGPGSEGVTVVCDGPGAVQDDGRDNRLVCPE